MQYHCVTVLVAWAQEDETVEAQEARKTTEAKLIHPVCFGQVYRGADTDGPLVSWLFWMGIMAVNVAVLHLRLLLFVGSKLEETGNPHSSWLCGKHF